MIQRHTRTDVDTAQTIVCKQLHTQLRYLELVRYEQCYLKRKIMVAEVPSFCKSLILAPVDYISTVASDAPLPPGLYLG